MFSASGLQPFLGGDRFATITPNDHGGVVWVASILCAIFSLLTFFLRCYTKRKYFGLDDWLVAAATVTAQAQYVAVFVATSEGLGKSYVRFSTSGIENIGRVRTAVSASPIALLISNVCQGRPCQPDLFLLSLCLAKISVILLIRRLYSPDMFKHLIICDGILVICAIWGLGSILGIVIDCSPLHLMGPERSFCSNLVMRWKAIGAIDAITELLAISMSVVVVWRLQMDVDRKARVVIAFLPRLLIIIFAILHIHYTGNFTYKPNTGVALAAPLVYQQLELCYSLILCTIPNLKGFLITFDTGMGLGFGYISQAYGLYGGSFQLSSFKNSATGSNVRASTNAENAAAAGKFRPDPVMYNASVVHAKGGGVTAERRSTHSPEDQSTIGVIGLWSRRIGLEAWMLGVPRKVYPKSQLEFGNTTCTLLKKWCDD